MGHAVSCAIPTSQRLVAALTAAGYTDVRPGAGFVYFSGPDGEQCFSVNADIVRERQPSRPSEPIVGGRVAMVERDPVDTLMRLIGGAS